MNTFTQIVAPIKAFQVKREMFTGGGLGMLTPHKSGKAVWFKTHTGEEHIAREGDWIIFTSSGEIYKMKDETFRRQYRKGTYAIPDHEVALLASDLTKTAEQYNGHQSLRQRIVNHLIEKLTL